MFTMTLMFIMKSLMVVFIIIAITKITTAIPTVTVALMTTMMIMIMSNWIRLSMISLIIKPRFESSAEGRSRKHRHEVS